MWCGILYVYYEHQIAAQMLDSMYFVWDEVMPVCSISGQKKLHVCHIEGCNKVYGKTSHLRAHLR